LFDGAPGRLAAIALAGIPIERHSVDQLALGRLDGGIGIFGSQENHGLLDQAALPQRSEFIGQRPPPLRS